MKEREKFSSVSDSSNWTTNLICIRQIRRKKPKLLLHVHGGLTMTLKPKEVESIFILFRQRHSKSVGIDRTKKT